MDFRDLLNKRRACHNFVPDRTIPDKELVELVKEASLTPSGYNAQPWEFVIIRSPENIREIQRIAFEQAHVADASALVVVLADTEIGRHADEVIADWVRLGYCTEEQGKSYRASMTKERPFEQKKIMALRNAALCAMTFIFAAEDRGYATCPMMGVSQPKLKSFLGFPEDRVVALVIAIGYSQNQKSLPRLPRRAPERLIHWEKF